MLFVGGVSVKSVAQTTPGPVIVGTGGFGRTVIERVAVAIQLWNGNTSVTHSVTLTEPATTFGHVGFCHTTEIWFGLPGTTFQEAAPTTVH
jgi:hypothetical protein